MGLCPAAFSLEQIQSENVSDYGLDTNHFHGTRKRVTYYDLVLYLSDQFTDFQPLLSVHKVRIIN